jgi:hypothetical protein
LTVFPPSNNALDSSTLADCGTGLPPQDAATDDTETPQRFRVLPKWKKPMKGFFHGQFRSLAHQGFPWIDPK